jgi:CheY-like chemotaxis protein
MPNRSKSSHNSRPLEVLHVDDNPADLQLVEIALAETRKNIAHKGVTSGAVGLAYVEDRIKAFELPPPDLILLDINMPGLNGIEFLERVKRFPQLAKVPVVILTTSQRQQDKEACRNLGARDFITKPTSFEDLLAAARKILAYIPHQN